MAIDSQPVIANCSFCGKPSTRVKKLVAGPGVFICDDCVGIASQLVTEVPVKTPIMAPWEHEATLEEVLRNLRPVASAIAQADRSLSAWVERARGLGATWTQVGEALGITRQSAWERFSGEE